MDSVFELIVTHFAAIVLTLAVILLVCVWYFLVHKPSARKIDRINEKVGHVLDALAELRCRINTNAVSLQAFRDDNASIQASFEDIERRLDSTSRLIANIPSQVIKGRTTEQYPREGKERRYESIGLLAPAVEEFCNLYNSGKMGGATREDLFKRYKKHVRIGVKNATDRRRNPVERPIFEKDNGGNFWAFYIEGEACFEVVPRYGLTLQKEIYGLGAFDDVFECPGFDPARSYPYIQVIRPARFEPDSVKEEWLLKEKGKLDLGNSE